MSQQTPPPRRNNDPKTVLEDLRKRIRSATNEYAAGHLNAPQFQAIHRHYTEKRMIVEQLMERNANSSTWEAAASPGMTGFLKERFEARPLFYVVFRRGEKRPLRSEGKIQQSAAEQLYRILQVYWRVTQWRTGLAQKSLGNGHWLLMVAGESAITLVVFMFQPSSLQTQHVRDLHADFERANARQLQEGAPVTHFVFPQRSLLQNKPE
ncbi:MAG: hypothetical protein KC496_01115 [Anaerolineae bacterium]|nr:hypothetical protein [Anaerolineae bacterium]